MLNLHDIIKEKKSIIFDMDGTLLDSEPLHTQSIAQILSSYGHSYDFAQIHELAYGLPDKELCVLFKSRQDLPVEMTEDAFCQLKTQNLLSIIENQGKEDLLKRSRQGAITFLEILVRYKKHLALVSASERIVVERILELLGIKTHFQVIIAACATLKSKPSPSPYFMALRQLASRSHEALIFEDSRAGIQAALASGAHVIQMNTKEVPPQEKVLIGLDDFTGL